MSRFLLEAASSGDASKVKALLDKGADIEWRHKGTGRTALSEAAITGQLDVARLLIERKANLNWRDSAMGFTPLGWAVQCDHPDLVELLLSAGADPNLPTLEFLVSPLVVASGKGDLRVVTLLLNAGANVNAATADGRTPLKEARASKHAEVVRLLEQAGGTADSPLPKPAPIPWPAVDETGATVDYSAPEKVLRSFIFAMNRWEKQAASLTLPHGPARNEKILTSMQGLFGAYCTPTKRPYGRAGSYQMPPGYDPKNEVLVENKLVNPRRAELITRDKRDENEFLYVLSARAGRWLLDGKKRRPIGTKWSNTVL